jgi:hypothetical protein
MNEKEEPIKTSLVKNEGTESPEFRLRIPQKGASSPEQVAI